MSAADRSVRLHQLAHTGRFAQQSAIDFPIELVPDALADAYDLAAAGTPDPDRSDEHLAELAEHDGLQEHEVSAARDGIELGLEYFERRGKLTADEQEEWIAEERARQAVEDASWLQSRTGRPR